MLRRRLRLELPDSGLTGSVSHQMHVGYPNDSELGRVLSMDYPMTYEWLRRRGYDVAAEVGAVTVRGAECQSPGDSARAQHGLRRDGGQSPCPPVSQRTGWTPAWGGGHRSTRLATDPTSGLAGRMLHSAELQHAGLPALRLDTLMSDIYNSYWFTPSQSYTEYWA